MNIEIEDKLREIEAFLNAEIAQDSKQSKLLRRRINRNAVLRQRIIDTLSPLAKTDLDPLADSTDTPNSSRC